MTEQVLLPATGPRLASLLLVLLFAGCTADDLPASEEDASHDTCDILYPDGSPFDCSTSLLGTEALTEERPTLTSGWNCRGRWAQEGGGAVVELYHHDDGRFAAYWNFPIDQEGETMVTGHVFLPDGGGQGWSHPYQPKGFKEWSEKPTTWDAEVHVKTVSLRLDVEQDGIWTEAKNASVIVGKFGAFSYYVMAFDGPRGREYVDVMSHLKRVDTLEDYEVVKRYIPREGYGLFVSVSLIGVYFEHYDPAPTPAEARQCLDALEVDPA